jgi:hypothetical protein
MTTDALERDLKALVEPQETDERLRLAIRTQLEERLNMRPQRRVRMRIALGSAAALAAAVVAVALVALIGTDGSSGPSRAQAAIVRHAIQAMTSPANSIVHVKETGVQNGTPVSVEWWQQTSPPYAMRLIKGPVGELGEAADDGTTTFRYDARANTIYQAPDSSGPTLIDPFSIVRQQLAEGSAQVAGTVTIDGVSLYKIELPNGVVGYFDATDYRPRYVDNPQQDGSVVRTQVVTYEELSITAENEKLLSVTAQHPDARVATTPADGPGKYRP